MGKHHRSLTASERHRLREIEDELEREDPLLAALLAPDSVRRSHRSGATSRYRRVATAVILLAGAVSLTVGIVVGSPTIGAVGFVVLVLSVSAMLADDQIVGRLRMVLGLHFDGE